MTCIVTKLTDREIPEHWRILVIIGDTEVYHDSAITKPAALGKLSLWLAERSL